MHSNAKSRKQRHVLTALTVSPQAAVPCCPAGAALAGSWSCRLHAHLPLREQSPSPQGSAKQDHLLWQQQPRWQGSLERCWAAPEAFAHNRVSACDRLGGAASACDAS